MTTKVRSILDQVVDDVQGAVDDEGATSRVVLGRRLAKRRTLLLATGEDPETGRIHVWFVSRGRTQERHHAQQCNLRSVAAVIHGYYESEIEDGSLAAEPSELTLSDLSEDICDAIRNDWSLHGGTVARNCTEPETSGWDRRTYGDRECWFCEITFTVSWGVSWSYGT